MFKITLLLTAFLASTPVFSAEQYKPGGQFYDGGGAETAPQGLAPLSTDQHSPEAQFYKGEGAVASTEAIAPPSQSARVSDAVKAELKTIIGNIEALRGSEIAEVQEGAPVDFRSVADKIESIKSALGKVAKNLDASQQEKVQKAIEKLGYIRGGAIAEAMQGMDADFGEVNTSLRQIMQDLETIQ